AFRTRAGGRPTAGMRSRRRTRGPLGGGGLRRRAIGGLDDRVSPADLQAPERADRPGRPSDGQLSHLVGGADADQEPGVVRRLHAESPLALAVDGPAADDRLDAGPDGVPVAPRPPQDQADPTVLVLRVVAQQRSGGVFVLDYDVDVSVLF